MELASGSRFAKLSLFSLLVAGNAAAQGEMFDLPRVSLTPIGGYTYGGEFEDDEGDLAVGVDDAAHYGLILNFRESTRTQWEVFYALQQTEADLSDLPSAGEADSMDLTIQYLQVGGTYVAQGQMARPFLAATVGLTRFDPDPLSFDSENFFSFGIGAGWQIQPSERLGLRLEARLLGTLLGTDTAFFCRTGPDENICAIRASGQLYTQVQTFLGLIFRF
jgi:hypothetical protein